MMRLAFVLALAGCSGSPNGSMYTARGNCPNPRMDSDTLDYREFENINIDNATKDRG